MKKVLATMLAFVMISTSICVFPLSASAISSAEAENATVVNLTSAGHTISNQVIVEEDGELFYKVIVQDTGYYNIISNYNSELSEQPDTRAELYEADNLDSSLKYDDDGGDGFQFKIKHYFEQGKVYYLGVSVYNESTNIPFNIIISKNENIRVFDDVVYEMYTDHCVVLDNKLNANKDVVIRSEIEGMPVTFIVESAFEKCEYITSVVIPSSVKEIGSGAFCDAKNLKTVTLSTGLEEINWSAFYGTQVESFSIPDTVTNICYDALISQNVKAINVNEGNQVYKSTDGVLFSKSGEKLIYFPTYNGKTTYNIPEGVIYIAENAFYNHQTLKSVVFSSSIDEIGPYAFQYSLLQSVNLNEGLKKIEEYAFAYSKNLTSIKLPNSLETIGRDAFSYSGLFSVDIPASVTEINYDTFYCENLKDIIFRGTEIEIGNMNLTRNVTIYGYTPSTAYTYANDNDYDFIDLASCDCSVAHTFVATDLVSEPTCTKKGVIKTSCIFCNVPGPNKNINPKGHSSYHGKCVECLADLYFNADLEMNKPVNATFTYDGGCLVVFKAQKDGDYILKVDNSNKKVYYESWVTDINKKESFYNSDYINVGKTKIEDISLKTGDTLFVVLEKEWRDETYTDISANISINCKHSVVETLKAVPASCTAEGLTEGEKCSICGTVTKEQQAAPILPHNFGDNGDKCTVCNAANPSVKAPAGATLVGKEFIAKKQKNTNIVKLTKKGKTIKATWKKVALKGYQIQVASNAKFTSGKKTVTINKNKTLSTTIKKFNGKKVYARIRTFKTVKFNGKVVKVFSKWSKTKVK